MSLRATPNLYVVRPADANETARAWRFAVGRDDAPTVLAFTRQGLPNLDPDAVPADAVERGAYVLQDGGSSEPDVILIGTGSEVAICVEAAERLEGDGVKARVVSMPCWDAFADQDQGYRDSVLPPSVRARVSVEAGASLGWERWIGDAGEAVAMRGFGASGPYDELYEHFGFTPEKVAEAAKRSIDRASK